MIRRHSRLSLVAFFALLFLVDWFLYFRYAGHFFQGDTVFLLNHRGTSLLGYLKEFVELNASGWYRPLSNELFESILYPFAGLHPIPYRIPVYAVFIAITIGVYALAYQLSRRQLVAGIAAFFFSIHTTNAYVTYDLGFMPELLYAFFYVGAALAYLRYIENGNKTAYRISLVCCAGSLLSKEAAVTLPATLLVAGILFGSSSDSFRLRLVHTLRATVPHMLILAVYLSIAVGYLDVQTFSIRRLFDSSQKPNPGDYIPVLNGGVFTNADIALSWAFNLPRQGHPLMAAGMADYLKIFRVVAFALAAVVLVRSERKIALFGFAWFWITLLPALPLVAHFLTYYVFLPVVGLSVLVGISFAWLYDLFERWNRAVAAVAIVLIFASVMYATRGSIRSDIRDNPLLGGSARIAANTLSDLKHLFPTLPQRATLFFADARQPLGWQHDSGGLIKMAYGRDDISVLYESVGDPVPEDQDVIVFEIRDGRLMDQTADYRNNRFKFMKFQPSDLRLGLSSSEVIAGQGNYTLRIAQLSNTKIRIAYTVDGGPVETFNALLDGEGKVTFDVAENTKRGVYRFQAFKISSGDTWIRAEETLTVR